MALSGPLIWSLWIAGAWAAFAFRPKWLVLTERGVPVSKRLAVGLLTAIYCIAVPILITFAVVFVLGVARGFSRAFG